MLNASQHSTLTALNPSITVTLSPQLPHSASENSVAITLPYSAFDLNISWPHAETSAYYFPLKRATNDTQYTLGRAFLQEAYLIADYERQNFSVWPCKWDSETTNANIIPILSVNSTAANPGSDNPSESTGGSRKGLSTGAIAGIAVGAAVGVILLALAAWFYIRRARSKGRASFELENTILHDPNALPDYHPEKGAGAEELDSCAKHELQAHNNKFGPLEAPDNVGKYEMEGDHTSNEADGRERRLGVVHELDAQEDAGLGPKITLEPPTAVTPGPGSTFPDTKMGARSR